MKINIKKLKHIPHLMLVDPLLAIVGTKTLNYSNRCSTFIIILLYLDCRFNCNKDGTINGTCDQISGDCHCKMGWYGSRCNKGMVIHGEKIYLNSGFSIFLKISSFLGYSYLTRSISYKNHYKIKLVTFLIFVSNFHGFRFLAVKK